MATKKHYDRARDRRSSKRATDVGVGRKKVKDALIEETIEESFDWLERGGWRRLWTILKAVFVTLIALIGFAVLVILDRS